MDLHAFCRWWRAPMIALACWGSAHPAAAAEYVSTAQDGTFSLEPSEVRWSDTARQNEGGNDDTFSANTPTAERQQNSAAYVAPVPLSPVPEPHIAYMLATGIAVLVLRGRRPSDDDKFDSHDHQDND